MSFQMERSCEARFSLVRAVCDVAWVWVVDVGGLKVEYNFIIQNQFHPKTILMREQQQTRAKTTQSMFV